MKKFNWMPLLILLVDAIVIILIILALSGCAQAILTLPDGTELKVNTFCKGIGFKQVQIGEIVLSNYKGTSPDVKATTPYGIIETKDGEQ